MTKVLQNALWGPPLPTLFAGLTLAWVSTTTITVNTGITADSTLQRTMKLSTALTKSTSGWAAGNAGGLDTGTIAANTGYHWYLIFNQTTGAMDVVFSATATPLAGPTLMPSGYTHFKWIGWTFANASNQWIKFANINDEFIWDAPLNAVGGTVNPGTAAVNRVVSSPPGLAALAKLNLLTAAAVPAADSPNGVYVSTPGAQGVADTPATAVVFTTYSNSQATGTHTAGATFYVTTDTSAQVRTRFQNSTGGTSFYLTTISWSIPRASVR